MRIAPARHPAHVRCLYSSCPPSGSRHSPISYPISSSGGVARSGGSGKVPRRQVALEAARSSGGSSKPWKWWNKCWKTVEDFDGVAREYTATLYGKLVQP
jgi:hypothetical protein